MTASESNSLILSLTFLLAVKNSVLVSDMLGVKLKPYWSTSYKLDDASLKKDGDLAWLSESTSITLKGSRLGL